MFILTFSLSQLVYLPGVTHIQEEQKKIMYCIRK